MALDYMQMLLGPIYYDLTDLRFNNQYGFHLSNQQLIEYKQFKNRAVTNHATGFVSLPLLSFNSQHVFYVAGQALCSLAITYLNTVVADMEENNSTVVERQFSDMLDARVYSELEGSMRIENIPTTRTKMEQIRNGMPPADKNEFIARNMMEAIKFICQKPAFNKENLKKLYDILSKDCLEDDQVFNGYYRDDIVRIDDYEGCPADKIDACMESMFDFVNWNLDGHDKAIMVLLPHICHYYVLYVHPYFDYNGRTARMVSLWINYLAGREDVGPMFISEAINDDRKKYYESLRNTRDMDNDISYFLIYILNTSIRYSMIYRNLDWIVDESLQRGITLTRLERVYIKKILMGSGGGYFDHKKFTRMANVDISKQAALRALNKLVEYGILSSVINQKNVKLFKLNENCVKYSNDFLDK